jgi:hypothetical protein
MHYGLPEPSPCKSGTPHDSVPIKDTRLRDTKQSQRKPAPMSYGLEGADLEQPFQQPIGRCPPKECRSFPKGKTVRLPYLEKEHSRHDLS